MRTFLLCALLAAVPTAASAKQSRGEKPARARHSFGANEASPGQPSGESSPGFRPSTDPRTQLQQGAQPAPPARKEPQHAPPAHLPAPVRFGRFDLRTPLAQLAASPDFSGCAGTLDRPSGHADCEVPEGADHVRRVQLAWDDQRGTPGELLALLLSFDPLSAPPLTDLEWQLTRAWGAPGLEQLRREKGQKHFTLQWEDAEFRATLEAGGPVTQPSRAIAIVLERRSLALSGDLAALKPKPFPGLHVRWAHKLSWEQHPYAVVYGTSLSPAQEALGESGPLWASQRNYVAVWKLEPLARDAPRKRWKPLWERIAGGEEDEDPQRVLKVETRDVTGDGEPDVLVELSCESCRGTVSELDLVTVRAGKLQSLLVKRELYRASVELTPGRIRIREPEDGDEGPWTVSTYSYDRSKGVFVLAREEHVGGKSTDEE